MTGSGKCWPEEDREKRMGKRKTNCRIALLLSLLLLVFTGCEKENEDTDHSLKTITDSGVLVLGLEENYPPMGFRNAAGEFTGFDIDLAREVCHRMGVTLQPRGINWDDKEKELEEGLIDCVWNGLSATPARAERMTLSEAYMKNDAVFVVAKNSRIKSAEDLEGKRVGTQAGSSSEEKLNGSEIRDGIELVLLDENMELFEQLDKGELDAIFLDSIFAYYYIAEYDKSYYLLPTVFDTEDIVIGFRKGDLALRDRIQEILWEMRNDGTLAEISKKWFGTDVTTVR